MSFNPAVFFESGRVGFSLLNNLVAYYTFNSNANDMLGVNNGTLVSGAYAPGKNNNAFSITAQTNVITVPDTNLFSFTNGANDLPFTISVWLYTTSYSANGNRFLSKRTDPNPEWLCTSNSTATSMVLHSELSGANIKSITTSNALSLNTWNHLVISYNGSVGKIYINGAEVTTTTNITGSYTRMTNSTSIVRIGSNNTTQVSTAQLGMMDELAIYKGRQLTTLEVTALYNSGVGKFYPFT